MDTTESTATIQTAVDTTTTATAAAVPKTPAVQATATATGAKAPEAEAISFLPSFEHSCKNFHALPAEVGNTDNQVGAVCRRAGGRVGGRAPPPVPNAQPSGLNGQGFPSHSSVDHGLGDV